MVYTHNLRTIKGRARGYNGNYVHEPRRREWCKISFRQLELCGLDPVGPAGRLGHFFSVKDLKREMKRDMPNHKIIARNKVPLIKEWFEYGNPALNELYYIRKRQGCRHPI